MERRALIYILLPQTQQSRFPRFNTNQLHIRPTLAHSVMVFSSSHPRQSPHGLLHVASGDRRDQDRGHRTGSCRFGHVALYLVRPCRKARRYTLPSTLAQVRGSIWTRRTGGFNSGQTVSTWQPVGLIVAKIYPALSCIWGGLTNTRNPRCTVSFFTHTSSSSRFIQLGPVESGM